MTNKDENTVVIVWVRKRMVVWLHLNHGEDAEELRSQSTGANCDCVVIKITELNIILN